MEKEINVKPKSIVVQESNPLLNPDRTIFYSLITGHMKEFDNIKINEELSEEEKFEQTNQLLRDKIEHFVNNLEKVYQTTNIGLTSNIEGAKQEYNGSVNNDRDWIEQFISNLWIQEKLTLYEVWNAAILKHFKLN